MTTVVDDDDDVLAALLLDPFATALECAQLAAALSGAGLPIRDHEISPEDEGDE